MKESFQNPGFELEERGGSPSFEIIDLSDGVKTASNGRNNATHPISSTMPTYSPTETRRMTRNIVIVGFGFLLLFTAYNGMSNIQSSLHPEEGLGTYTNATVYGFLILSSLFIPSVLMRWLTVKWTLVLSMFGYTFYMAAQYHPRFVTMLPAAAIVGICAAPLWASKSFYLSHVGNQNAGTTGDNAEIVIIRYFGIFFMLFQTSHIWGNLISSQIFSSGAKNYPNETQIERCGVKFCPGDLFSIEDDDSNEITSKVYIFAAVCLLCAFMAILLIASFMDPLTRYGEKERVAGMERKTGVALLLSTLAHLKNPYQVLLIPLTIFSGLEQGFLSTDFTQAFITCSWGLHNVGYVFICYGMVDAVFSISFGPVVRHFGRAPVYTFGAIVNYSMVGTMLFWSPNPEQPVVFFVIAAFWGLADACWQTQINALYGVLFPSNEEAAFCNYRLWESIGFIVAYVNGNLLCIKSKLILLVVVLSLGMMGFYVIEHKESKRKGREEKKQVNTVQEKM